MELGSPKQLKSVLASAAVLGAVYLAAWEWLPANLASYQFPTPKMPQPNGYDLYLDAYRRFSVRPIDPRVEKSAKWVRPPVGKSLPPSAIAHWVDINVSAFAAYDKAQKAVFLHSPVRGDTKVTDTMFRLLGREKAAQAVARSEQGDHKGAIDSALDIFELGLKVPRGGGIISALNGCAIESKARAVLGPEMAYLTGPQAAAATRRLEMDLNERVSFSNILNEEKRAMLYTLQTTLNAVLTDKGYGDTVIERLAHPLLTVVSPRRQAESYAAAMDVFIGRAKRPWPEWGSPPQTAPWQQSIINVTHDTRFNAIRIETSANLFLGRLALHAFRKTTGVYPASLQELVSHYLKTVPRDPFTDSALHYQRIGKRYRLWSIGPDMQNDGGRPITKTDFLGRQSTALVSKDSVGDIVAGVND